MKAVVQRVSSASVTVGGNTVGSIRHGLLVLIGITHTDTDKELQWMCDKLLSLRVFPDDEGRMNRSVIDCHGGLLLVSQLTLYGSLEKGTRPSYIKAAPAEISEPLYDRFVGMARTSMLAANNTQIATGVFGAMMDVHLVNDGPVTILLER